MEGFKLHQTRLWRGGKKSGEVWQKTTQVNLTTREDEIHLWFDQGGLERGTRFELHIGRADFSTLMAALEKAMGLPE